MSIFSHFLLSSILLSLFSCLVLSCEFHGAPKDLFSIASENNAARSVGGHKRQTGTLAILNVRIFDGFCLQPPSTVVISGSYISKITSHPSTAHYDATFDGAGRTLLPGLIDSHTHPMSVSDLSSFTKFGVTTAVDAFCPSPAFCLSLANHPGLTSLVAGSYLATAPNSTHARMLPPGDSDFLISNISQIPAWVEKQVGEGARFIKIIGSAPGPGLSLEAQTALVQATHRLDRKVVQHIGSYDAFVAALKAGADQIHHSTIDRPLDEEALALLTASKRRGVAVCPTLTIMRSIVENLNPAGGSYEAAEATVSKLHAVGMPIIVGTDANNSPGAPAQVLFGSSIHDELENLVAAGLSPIEALNAATKVPAKYFGLKDRGRIEEGTRADLVLIDGDPTKDVKATRNIVKVWIGGEEFQDVALN